MHFELDLVNTLILTKCNVYIIIQLQELQQQTNGRQFILGDLER